MRALLLVLALWAVTAAAQDNTQGWSIIGGKTVGNQQTALEAGIGFPGVHASILRGVAPNLDIGGRISFDYGLEGLTNEVVPGLKLQGLMHFRLVDSGIVSLMLAFEPGPLFAFHNGETVVGPGGFPMHSDGYTGVGLAFPIRLQLGLAASSALNVGVHVELPMWVSFASGANNAAVFVLPMLAGAGAEYFVKHNLLVYFELRLGPTLFSDNTPPVFTLIANVGVGYRF